MSKLDELILQKPEDHDLEPITFSIEADSVKKPIVAYLWLSEKMREQSNLHLVIVTHGAGGTALSPSNLHLCRGLASSDTPSAPSAPEQLAIAAYNGVSNLKARVKALRAVIDWASASERVARITLAGRSMGCRASAIAYVETLAANPQDYKLSDKLILESYPLQGKGEEARKQVLADLPARVDVLFVVGTRDEMCSLGLLKDTISTVMQASSSLLVVKDADHGMKFTRPGRLQNVTKKEVTEQLGERAGREAKRWLTKKWLSDSSEVSCHTSELSWPDEADESPDCVWSGWEEDDELQKRPQETSAKRSREASHEEKREQSTKRPNKRKKA